MKPERQYLIIPEQEVLIFGITVRETEPVNPEILYDGGEHALFYRSLEEEVILDYINPSVRERLKNETEVGILEINFDTEETLRQYVIPVKQVKSLPIPAELIQKLQQEYQELANNPQYIQEVQKAMLGEDSQEMENQVLTASSLPGQEKVSSPSLQKSDKGVVLAPSIPIKK